MTIEVAIVITKHDLYDVIHEWVVGGRAGAPFRTLNETAALPACQVAEESTEYVWSELTKGTTP